MLHTLHPYLEEIELWTSLMVNGWVIVTGVVLLFERIWNARASFSTQLAAAAKISVVVVLLTVGAMNVYYILYSPYREVFYLIFAGITAVVFPGIAVMIVVLHRRGEV